MLATELRPPPDAPPDDEWVRAAFHELHGRSLNGFALLLMLGNPDPAGQLAGAALGAGMAHVDELRHPERAAAWLRAHVVKGAATGRRREGRVSPLALEGLGADAAVVAGLAALDLPERAAFIAAEIETLDPRDVAVVVERDGARLRNLLTSARRRYLAAYLRAAPEEGRGGPLTDRLHEIGRQTVG
jgi:DNA-directed RNA polymerase specialized sigma24 family protein